VTPHTAGDKGQPPLVWTSRPGLVSSAPGWSNQGVPSCYRFSGPFVVRLTGLGLVLVALVLLLVVALVSVLSLPTAVLGVVVAIVSAAVAVGLAVLATRRPVVVRFDEGGYRIRLVRGAGVRQAPWTQVEHASATTVAGERCVVLHLRDGRTSTVPVGVLAGRPDDFVRDLQQHLNRGHGYRPLTAPPS
jgi:hypothetical protein